MVCILICSNIANIIIQGFISEHGRHTTGILLDPLVENLGGGRGSIAVAGSPQVGVCSLSETCETLMYGRMGEKRGKG